MGETSQTLTADIQLLCDVFHKSPIGIAVENLEGQPLFVNPALCSMLGFSEEEMCNKHYVQFSPPEDAAKDWVLFQQLRAGSIDSYELEKRYLRRDGWLVWGRLRVYLLDRRSSPLVIAMVEGITAEKAADEALLEVNRALKEQAELLRSREELLKIFVKSVPVGVAMVDRDMRYLQVSDRWCADYSMDSSNVHGRSHYELFPDIPEHWKEVHRRALVGETLRADDDRWDRADGTTTWVRWEIRPWKTSSGEVGGILIFAENITDRKKAEQVLADVPRKLIEAHEEERTWLARELHDDVNQRLALLVVELEQWGKQLPDSFDEFHNQVHEVQQSLSDLADDIQALSHRLHSSKLEYLGLVAASKSLCKEFSDQQKVEIDFHYTHIPRTLSMEISLNLFRVLQESLQNAVKHSRVRHFRVDLCTTAQDIQLTVSDLGVGFDVQNALAQGGLGLTSMRERLQLVKGQISIESRLGAGTRIHARVPFTSESESIRAA